MAIWKSSRLLRKRQKSLNSSKVMPISTSWRRFTNLERERHRKMTRIQLFSFV